MQIYEILWLSGLLVAVSGLFFWVGCIEHQKAIQLMEDLLDFIFGAAKHEGTDAD